ncbi:MAG: AEC family transporter [Selenomonas sp.]|uniref:AEC family transporter n=1 Tax=Selenomonas sp. TaxID=2053611 RepID=UPI0025E2DABB|nr:AEC family transporter [Selenomonas sp.]MCR5439198.1 AEC family transporter [Selenomonas sp.]
MLSNLFVAIGAVVPMFCLILIGVFVKRTKMLTDEELVHTNRMVFRVFFFCMMFYNIYTTDLSATFRPGLMLFGGLGVIAVFLLATLFVCKFEPSNKRRGAMIQAIFRSNFVLMGIPLVSNIFGEDQLALPTMMIAIVVPIYNVVAVFVLETFRGGRFYLPGILLGVLKNPMILGAIAAVVFLLVGVPVPAPVLKPIKQVAAATTPVALIILGASFKGSSFHAHVKQLVACVAARLILVPAVMIGLAIYLGFRGMELITLTAIFASPCAVASFAMAQQMGSDADLAGNCVVYTSALSCLTLFGWVFALKSLGLF